MGPPGVIVRSLPCAQPPPPGHSPHTCWAAGVEAAPGSLPSALSDRRPRPAQPSGRAAAPRSPRHIKPPFPGSATRLL